VKIRKYISSDLDNIQRLEQEKYGYVLSSYLENNDLHTHFILEKDDFLGYISLWHDEKKAQIESIVIRQENEGYGQVLLDYTMKYLNNYVVTLEVREFNSKAIYIYEKFGFKMCSIRKNYYSNNENAILMIKEVKE